MTAYDTPEATAQMMERITANAPKIGRLKRVIMNRHTTYHQKIKAFTECYMMMQGDPHAQKRLVLELETASTQLELDNR